MVQSRARLTASSPAARVRDDIFVHMETLRRYGITELRPGQVVLVRFGDGPKGLMAAEIRPDGPAAGRLLPTNSRSQRRRFPA